ncbi:hypothetical protein [Streptomyces sp. NPDC060035]|uniref:hypothetical protein n=1 Tax=Streptomyces sp. NPDC060035 TaxID=3347044 RepID=UPI003686BCC0
MRTQPARSPLALVWDNPRSRLMPQAKEFIAANESWLTVFQFPACAPDLTPREGIWSLVPSAL